MDGTFNLLDTTKKPIDVKGRVTNENGEPIDGASVMVKGSGKGTLTNANGEFELKNVDGNATMEISYVGYEAKKVKVNGNAVLTITLSKAISSLDETIVIAYGTTTKRLNTGSVSKVTAEEIERQPVSNPLAALQGRVPGLVVTQTSGVPGGSFNVQIRGRNSFRSDGHDPLYIIDGVPFTS